MLRDKLKRIQKELKNEKKKQEAAMSSSLKEAPSSSSGNSSTLLTKSQHEKSLATNIPNSKQGNNDPDMKSSKKSPSSLSKSKKGDSKPSSSSNNDDTNNTDKTESKKRKLDQALSNSEQKSSKKKNKNPKKKKKQEEKEGAVLKVQNENIFITEQQFKECFPNCSAVLRIGPRLILVAFEKEEQAIEYLKQEEEKQATTKASDELQNDHNYKKISVKKDINGQQFTISLHGTKDIYRPSWFDVKPRTTSGVSLGLNENQKVTSKFASFLEKSLLEKFGSSENVSISDIHKGKIVFFEDASVEEKFKNLIESGAFSVPPEYIREKKKKERKSKK
ncbi:hypothetical protein FDP41_001522 [Naegleria fowleri]|uniref:Uncharacterized protein n=1 Tax=Naegleria fowleri TaxID=5763 RepID=A0A6A5C1S6_NAEFO|nr:uncharacterized protein FDP41_001522 [Naegleria fowleri]KAF0979179.1 hypothetical protein FDP41_001522 [Naegleria fowleri]